MATEKSSDNKAIEKSYFGNLHNFVMSDFLSDCLIHNP